jgi:uncharacterized membrane protein
MLARNLMILASAAGVAATAHSQSTFTGLGDLPGGAVHSDAAAVSSDGSIVVGSSISAAPGFSVFECFTWTLAGGMVGRGTLPGGTGSSYGLAVGGASTGSLSGPFHYGGHAFVAGGDEGFVDMHGIGDLPGPTFWSSVLDFSDAGRYVGIGNNAGAHHEAITGIPGAAGLSALGGPLGWINSGATAISDDGAVIAGWFEDGAHREACRWVGGVATAMGDLPGGSFFSEALGTNGDGSVIVGASIGMSIDTLAFRWTAAGGMVSLGGATKRANACSGDGNVVVGSVRYGAGTRAFVWDTVHGLRMLDDVLANEHGLSAALAGWTLLEATDISTDGRVIVGNGYAPSGALEGWRAHIDTDAIQAFCFGNGEFMACPCATPSAVSEHAGCKNSTSFGGALVGAGAASLAADTVVLAGTHMTPFSSVVYLQGNANLGGRAGVWFGDGLRCVTSGVVRLAYATNSGSGSSAYPSAGDASLSVKGGVVAAGTKLYQAWYRDAASFCTVSTFNLTNAVSVKWSP